ncbi:tRNA pseudouridine(13) synthase TruD [Thermococci archaeon]|nr:MAG: tRNA pseudouridine(13) synthase TruD [Thermococci archaeon]
MMRSKDETEASVGMFYYSSNEEGIGGITRKYPEDFVVVEKRPEGLIENTGKNLVFLLIKKNIETFRAIEEISERFSLSPRLIGVAGLKDKRALTYQYISIRSPFPKRDLTLMKGRLRLKYLGRRRNRILMGDLLGNYFRIVIRETRDLDKALEIRSELESKGIPNYFGLQRFGVIRPVTHVVGKMIVKGDLEGAVKTFLTMRFEAEDEKVKKAREILEEDWNYSEALDFFPTSLRYERTILESLKKNPRDYASAIRSLPRGLSRMFIHSYQSYLTNKIISRRMEIHENLLEPVPGERTDKSGRPLVLVPGFAVDFSSGEIGKIEREVLEEDEISPRNFRVERMPELRAPGKLRRLSISPGIGISGKENGEVVFHFFLEKGSYATVVIREFMKTDALSYS